MFDPVDFRARTEADGHLRIDLPLDLPPDSEVRVVVSESALPQEPTKVLATAPIGPRRRFASREEWEAHARRVVGSIPDIERPEQGALREIEPL